MKDRSGAKKLYKVKKNWVAAGVASVALLSVAGVGANSVSAATKPGDAITTLTKAAKEAGTARTAAENKLGDAVNALEDLAATKNLPNEKDVNEVIVEGIQAYQDAKAGKTTTADLQQQATVASDTLNAVKAQSAKKDLAAVKDAATKAAAAGAARTAAENKLGDAVNALEDLAATKNLPNEKDVNEVIAEGIQAYQDAKAGKTTTADLQQQATVASDTLSAVKAQSAKKDLAAIKDAATKAAAAGAARATAEKDLGNAITDLEDLAAAKTLPNESDVNDVIAEGIQAYQDAKAGKTTTAEIQQQATVAKAVLAQINKDLSKPNQSTIASDNAAQAALFNKEHNTAANRPNLSTEFSNGRANSLEVQINQNMNKMENLPNMSTLASEKAKDDALAKLTNESGSKTPSKPTAEKGTTEVATKGNEGSQTPAPKSTTLAPKATKAAPKASSNKALTQTGNSVNTGATVVGAIAAMGALFGLAGTSLKKRNA